MGLEGKSLTKITHNAHSNTHTPRLRAGNNTPNTTTPPAYYPKTYRLRDTGGVGRACVYRTPHNVHTIAPPYVAGMNSLKPKTHTPTCWVSAGEAGGGKKQSHRQHPPHRHDEMRRGWKTQVRRGEHASVQIAGQVDLHVTKIGGVARGGTYHLPGYPLVGPRPSPPPPFQTQITAHQKQR